MSEQGPASQPLRVGRKVSHTPFPTREELMKRNSFPGRTRTSISIACGESVKMTDREYEKMMVEAVNSGVDIGHVMHVLNTKIAVAEQMVESLYETRRELINRFNLNKGDTNA